MKLDKISSFAKVRRGASPRPIGDPKYFGGTVVGWVRISDVTASSKYLRKTEQYVSPLGESLSVRVDKGDLIMSICGTIGRPILVEMPACIHDGFVQFYDVDGAINEYMYYLLQFHEKGLEGKGQPGTQVNLNTKIVENYEAFFPLLPEQRKIARILSTVDAVIEKTEAAIAKYKAIKQGMMHDLFSRGLDENGRLRPRYEDAPHLYKHTELGWVPVEWEVESLETVTDFVDYRGKTPPKSDYGVFLVTARNIKGGTIDYELSKEYIPEHAYEEAMSRGKVCIGDVLITTEAPMGNVAQIDNESVALAQRIIKYRGKKNVLINDYLAINLVTDSFQRQLVAESTGSTVLGIKGSRLHKLSVFVPKQDEQLNVVKAIKTLNKLVRSEEQNLSKLLSIKQGLMSDLLTGNKPVNIEKEGVV